MKAEQSRPITAIIEQWVEKHGHVACTQKNGRADLLQKCREFCPGWSDYAQERTRSAAQSESQKPEITLAPA